MEGAQGFSFHVLHDEVGHAIGLAHFMDDAEVGVIEGRSGARLAQEPGSGAAVGEEPLADEFDGDAALQVLVPGPEHQTHAPLAELFVEAVMGEDLTGLESHERRIPRR